MKSLAKGLILVVLFASAATAQTWDPEMHLKLKAVGSPRVSPDGKKMVYTVNEAVMTAGQERVRDADLDGKSRHQAETPAHVRREVVHQSEMVARTATGSPSLSNRKDNRNRSLSPELERRRGRATDRR